MTKFKSTREDRRGHKPPLSQKEPSCTFGLRVPISTATALRDIPRDKIRAVLKRLVKEKEATK